MFRIIRNSAIRTERGHRNRRLRAYSHGTTPMETSGIREYSNYTSRSTDADGGGQVGGV